VSNRGCSNCTRNRSDFDAGGEYSRQHRVDSFPRRDPCDGHGKEVSYATSRDLANSSVTVARFRGHRETPFSTAVDSNRSAPRAKGHNNLEPSEASHRRISREPLTDVNGLACRICGAGHAPLEACVYTGYYGHETGSRPTNSDTNAMSSADDAATGRRPFLRETIYGTPSSVSDDECCCDTDPEFPAGDKSYPGSCPNASPWLRGKSLAGNRMLTRSEEPPMVLLDAPYGFFAGRGFRPDVEIEWDPPCTHEAPNYVHPFGGFPTIQSALDAIPPGSVLCITSGAYHESLEITKDVVIKGVGEVVLYPESLKAQMVDHPIITIHPGIRVRLQNLSLQYGRIASAAAHAFAAPILDVSHVVVADAPGALVEGAPSASSGAITGNLHLRARWLSILRSSSHGINIVGSADILNLWAAECKGVGAIIDNSIGTPTEYMGPWYQQVISFRCERNELGGLQILNHVGNPFRISGPFNHNRRFGIQLLNADQTYMRDVEAGYTETLGGELVGVGVLVEGSSDVLIYSSWIHDNDIALFLISCPPLGLTRVTITDNRFSDNAIHFASATDGSCGSLVYLPDPDDPYFDDGGLNLCTDQGGNYVACQVLYPL